MCSFDLGWVLKSIKKSEDKANQLKEVITENISHCVSTEAFDFKDFKSQQMCPTQIPHSKQNRIVPPLAWVMRSSEEHVSKVFVHFSK